MKEVEHTCEEERREEEVEGIHLGGGWSASGVGGVRSYAGTDRTKPKRFQGSRCSRVVV